MAIRIGSKPNTETTDLAYPHGRFKDFASGSPGTPIKNQTMGDIIQLFVRLLFRSGRGAGNNLQDNDTNGYELYEALGFWQEGTAAMDFFEADMSTTAATVTSGNILYNKFMILGNNLQWMVSCRAVSVTGTQADLFIPIDPEIVAILGSAFFDNNNAVQLGYLEDGAGVVPFMVKQDITTDAVVLSRLDGAAFSASINFQFHITAPIITAL